VWWKPWRRRRGAASPQASVARVPTARLPKDWSWSIVGASEAGTSHRRREVPCEDAFTFEMTCDGLPILVVADGAGGSRFGVIGAEIAVQVAVAEARARLERLRQDGAQPTEGLLREVFVACREALAAAVSRLAGGEPGALHEDARVGDSTSAALAWRILSERWCATVAQGEPAGEKHLLGGLTTADFHSTLAVAILAREWSVFGNIGDGWIVVRQRGETARAVASTAKGEYIEETFFLDSPQALDEAAYERLPTAELDAVALLTDGAAWFSIEIKHKVPGHQLFEALFALAGDQTLPQEEQEGELRRLLASERVCGLTDDDKTLLLAARVDAVESMAGEGESIPSAEAEPSRNSVE
jgi:Protein phosphatase 2C